MRKLYSVLALLFVLFACSKDDTTTPEPEPIQQEQEVKPKFTITIGAGSGGSVSTAGGIYEEDSEITVTATPVAEYLFESWSDGSTDNPRVIKVVSDLEITANFIKKQYDLEINIVGEGTVTETVVLQGAQYNSGSQIKLTATPSEGWEFDSWSGAIESPENPVIITIDTSREVTATFIRKKYDLTINVEGEGEVAEEIITQPGQYDYETQIKLTAIAAEGWEFSSWSGSIETTDNPIIVSLNDNIDIRAVFQRTKYDLNITIEGGGSVSEELVVPSGQYDYEAQVKLTATPDEGWEFSSWSGAIDSTENPIVVDLDGPKDITATFIRKKYDLTINVEGEGEVAEEIITQPGQYDYETQIKLTAIPSDGFEFAYWGGDIQSSENPIVITMNNDLIISAVFGSTDIDGDGVPNSLDLDNNTPFGVPVDANGVMLNPIYLDSNGITIKAREWAQSGFVGEINGSIYTVVDEATLRNMVTSNQDVTKVVTSLITNMNNMFKDQSNFNQEIGSWDVSNVSNMSGMFQLATSFNQDIGSWDVSNVINISTMFGGAISFNQDIGSWDTGNVRFMIATFSNAYSFNQDINSWDVSNVESTIAMFQAATSFNQDLNQWNTSNLVYPPLMFSLATSFNGDISNWDMSKVTYLDRMFYSANSFNGDLSGWDTSNVIGMSGVFQNAINFNQDISQWDVSSVQQMPSMFSNAFQFNQDISNWDVSNVTNMTNMFFTEFDYAVGGIGGLLYEYPVPDGNMNFNQDLSNWNVNNVVDCWRFSNGTGWTLPKPNFTNCN